MRRLASFIPKSAGRWDIEAVWFCVQPVRKAIGLSRLGISSLFLGAVGADPAGRAIRAALTSEGVDTSHLQTRSEPTGLLLREWTLAVEPDVYYFRKDTAFRHWMLDEAARDDAMQCEWLHLSGIAWMLGASVTQSVQILSDRMGVAGKTVSLDLNVRVKLASIAEWQEKMAAALRTASVVFASTADLLALTGTAEVSRLYESGFMRNSQVWIVKEGSERTCVYQQGHCLGAAETIPVPQVIDVVGAGDGFAAGVIAARLAGEEWAAALKWGNIVGGFAVASAGDWEGYPDKKRLMEYLSRSHQDR